MEKAFSQNGISFFNNANMPSRGLEGILSKIYEKTAIIVKKAEIAMMTMVQNSNAVKIVRLMLAFQPMPKS